MQTGQAVEGTPSKVQAAHAAQTLADPARRYAHVGHDGNPRGRSGTVGGAVSETPSRLEQRQLQLTALGACQPDPRGIGQEALDLGDVLDLDGPAIRNVCACPGLTGNQ